MLGTSVTEFGARGDGGTDDTDAIQKALTAASVRKRAGTVLLPGGDYMVSETLVIDDVVGPRLIGEGGASRLIWAGHPDEALLRLSSVQGADVRDFTILTNANAPLAAGLHIYSRHGATFTSKRNSFTNLIIDGTTTGIGTAVQMGGSVGHSPLGWNANNDFHCFQNVVVANYGRVGFRIEDSQVYCLLFLNCLALGGPTATYGVSTRSGNFTWVGGGGGAHQAADFYMGGLNNGANLIQGGTFEGSPRLLVTGGPTSLTAHVELDGLRWSGDRIHPDGVAIDFRMPGPFLVRNCRLGSDPAKPLQIVWNPGGAEALRSFIFEGNRLYRSGSAPLFPQQRPTRLHGNIDTAGEVA